jgi:hypothetical protein
LESVRKIQVQGIVYQQVKVKQFRYRPGMAQWFQEVKVPRLHDNGTGWW